VRKRFKGWPARVSAGYRGPKIARSLHPSGFREVMVYNADGLKEIDPTTQAARISHTVGKRKRAQILTEARKMEIVILNQRQTKETTKKEEELTEEAEKEEVEAEETEKEEEAGKAEEPEKEERASNRGKRVEKK